MNSKELTDLIHQHTRIILPEFGAFLVKDSGEKEFNPNNVSFSPFLRYNDGLLEVYVAKSRGISKEDASKEVHNFVETVKNELLEKGIYPLEGLGVLKRDQRGSLSFSLSQPDSNKDQPEASGVKATAAIKKTPIEDVTTEESNNEKKEMSVGEIKPTEETKIPAKRGRKPKAKVEKLTVTKEIATPSKEADETNQKFTQNILTEPIVELKVKPEKESILPPKSEPIIIPIPEKIIETKSAEKIVVTPIANDKKIEPEKLSLPNNAPNNKVVKKKTGMKSFIYTGIAIAVIALLVLFIKNYYLAPKVEDSISDGLSTSKTTENVIKKEVDDAKDKIDKPKDDIDKAYNELASDKKEKAIETKELLKKEEAQEEAIKNSLIKESQSTTTTGLKFYIIAGSFKSHDFAEKFLNNLKKEGYNPAIVVQPSGMNAISIGAFSTRTEADKAMKKYKEKLSNLWILKL